MKTTIRNIAAAPRPKVLLVVAHPDDEYYCAATIYRLTQEIGGTVDQLIITNGEGGYRYALLAERLYNQRLTREEVGRAMLPAIRKEEVVRAGRILGIRRHYFLDQQDTSFTLDFEDMLEQVWDRAFLERQLDRLLADNSYDFVFVVLPTQDTHGHHKAATLLALERVAGMAKEDRPVVLGCAYRSSTEGTMPLFSRLQGYPLTQVRYPEPLFCFDRRHKFGPGSALDYAVVVHWMMAEHKSQGYFQTTYGLHDVEAFWYFASNGAAGLARARALFDALQPGRNEDTRLGLAA